MVLLSSMITRQINRIVFRQSIRLISLGDRISLVRKITAKDVENFAKLTGDVNPIHLDCEYAKQTRYGKCIVHGIFIQGLVSCLLGVHFPGIGCVAYGVNCKFTEPLFIDETCRIDAVVSKLRGRLVTFDVNAYSTERNVTTLVGNFDVFVTREQLTLKPPVDNEIIHYSD
ncbi:Hydroxyacyl-thioester dehydratase type 2, mitochondrial [Schistosoma japonicum]|nr:Hydroxyacyl-thioester dehydratase type 2, mitochondrial [Schistosoma japonicum]KAH8861202.1 Hydroxyacyl-thioester dehydratase type 2, mitochondrial [Schistosoma japonicum]